MSKTVNALSVVGMVHAPKNESTPVPYVQMMQGDKKVGSFVRCEYIRFLLDNPAAARAAIAQAESMLPAVAAPAVAAPVASAPAVADPAAALAALATQMQALQAALGLAAPAPAVVAPVAAPAPAVSVTPASAPLAARSRVRAAAKR